jgi:hypothetical protein
MRRSVTLSVDVVFRRFELVLDEFEHRGVGKIRDREHRLEHGLQALVGPPAERFLHQQELVVGRLLNLDEVRHLCDFLDFPEKLANALATCKRLRHLVSSRSVEPPGRDDSPEGRHPSRPSGQASKPAVSMRFGCARTVCFFRRFGGDMRFRGQFTPKSLLCVPFRPVPPANSGLPLGIPGSRAFARPGISLK